MDRNTNICITRLAVGEKIQYGDSDAWSEGDGSLPYESLGCIGLGDFDCIGVWFMFICV